MLYHIAIDRVKRMVYKIVLIPIFTVPLRLEESLEIMVVMMMITTRSLTRSGR